MYTVYGKVGDMNILQDRGRMGLLLKKDIAGWHEQSTNRYGIDGLRWEGNAAYRRIYTHLL